MSNFSQDSRQLGAENMPPTTFRVQADVPALNVYSFCGQSLPRCSGASRPPWPLWWILRRRASRPVQPRVSQEALLRSTRCAHRAYQCCPHKARPRTFELYNEIKQMIAHRTCLPEDGSALVAFWAISTWFREVLQVFPLLVSGPAHVAFRVLNVLEELCCQPDLLADFRRGDLKNLRGGTLLISANLDNRSVALLGNLTNRRFLLVEGRDVLGCAGSTAIYLGEDSPIKKIRTRFIFMRPLHLPMARLPIGRRRKDR